MFLFVPVVNSASATLGKRICEGKTHLVFSSEMTVMYKYQGQKTREQSLEIENKHGILGKGPTKDQLINILYSQLGYTILKYCTKPHCTSASRLGTHKRCCWRTEFLGRMSEVEEP